MKKRWFVTALFAMVLCVGAVSAQAAVVSGGTEYVWYTDMGRGEYNENNQFVSNEGQQLYLSADQGGSYAELPGLREAQKRTGLSYAITVEPNAANDGGLSVKARDRWSGEYTWFRDYSAQEIATVLKNAVPTPVEVFATNGVVTVGTRYVNDYGNDDPTQPIDYGNSGTGGYNGDRLVYSTDGVTWLPAEQEKGEYYSSIESGWWDGSAFHAGRYVSADGLHWTNTGEEQVDPTFSLACELGPYRFEYAENDAGEWGVYLMDHTSPDTGVLLPHMTEAAKAKWVNIGKLRAWYGPNDTVILAAYDIYSKERLMASIDYPISSLDWCLENLKTQFRTIEPVVSNGKMSLGVGLNSRSESRLACNDGSGWRWAENVPWGKEAVPLFCEGGYFWVKGAGHHLYRSANGRNWLPSDAIRPEDQHSGNESYLNYKIAATDNGFIASRHGGVGRYGMFGMSGGGWFEGYSKVYLLNKNFELMDSYDFGRRVWTVGWYNGAYYAKVANSDGHRDGWAGDPGVFSEAEGSALYRSADGKSWERLPDIYIDYENIMVSTKGGSGVGNRPTGDPNKPQHSIARLDRWRFVLDEYFAWDFERNVREDHPTYRVCLMGDSAADWVELPHLGEAIKAQGVGPWELSAAYNPDGTVEVKVTDKNDANKYISISYPTSSLDWVKENLMGINGRELPQYSGTNNDAWDIESKYGVADLIAVELANGESEIVYRSEATGGQWKWYDSAPWSGFVELLPFSGKDFMVLDKADGKVYLSSDGVSWREATGNWIVRNQAHNYWEYAFVWTGEHYLGVCTLADDVGEEGKYRTWSEKSYQAVLLDENLNQVRAAADFGDDTTAVGYRDGVGYVEIMRAGLNRSTDGGKTWEVTDVMQVRDALVGLQ